MLTRLDRILDLAPPEAYRDTLVELYHNYICREHAALPDHFGEMAERMMVMI